MILSLRTSTESKQSGFTLLEMAFVLALISIIVIVAIPKFQGIRDRYQLEASAQKVAEMLRYTKQLAMDRRETMGLVFDETFLSVYKLSLSSGGSPLSGESFGKVEQLTARVTLNSSQSYGLKTGLSGLPEGSKYIYFDYRGFVGSPTEIPSYPRLDARLKFEHGGQELYVNIAKVTGYVILD